jgi:hypothetical protein
MSENENNNNTSASVQHPHFARLYGAVALVQPACRMCVLEAIGHPEQDDEPWLVEIAIYPVLAIRSSVESIYRSPPTADGERPPMGATPQEMADRGWTLQSTQVIDEPLLFDSECCGIVTFSEFDREHSSCDLAACPWDVEEDRERLAPLIEVLRDEELRRMSGLARYDPDDPDSEPAAGPGPADGHAS